jgi:hypothetical protein
LIKFFKNKKKITEEQVINQYYDSIKHKKVASFPNKLFSSESKSNNDYNFTVDSIIQSKITKFTNTLNFDKISLSTFRKLQINENNDDEINENIRTFLNYDRNKINLDNITHEYDKHKIDFDDSYNSDINFAWHAKPPKDASSENTPSFKQSEENSDNISFFNEFMDKGLQSQNMNNNFVNLEEANKVEYILKDFTNCYKQGIIDYSYIR